jgi:hypothetical protein
MLKRRIGDFLKSSAALLDFSAADVGQELASRGGGESVGSVRVVRVV